MKHTDELAETLELVRREAERLKRNVEACEQTDADYKAWLAANQPKPLTTIGDLWTENPS